MTKYEKYKLIIGAFFCSLFLLILFSYSSNGRYIFIEESKVILDTKSGTLYITQGSQGLKYLEIDDYTEMIKNNENE